MSDDAKKLVLSLWGKAFRQGELEHCESVSDATLKKNSDAVLAAQLAIMSEIERLRAENAKLREALQKINGMNDDAECCGSLINYGDSSPPECCGKARYGLERAQDTARAVLKDTQS